MVDLYALPPEEFTAARNALAKELKAAGKKDEAAAVAKLRRPSVAAWALNQVARTKADLVEAALAAGQELRAATEATVAGEAGELRAASAAERTAANAVVKAAAAHLGARAEALTPALLATLRVAALDDEVADELRRGVLTSDQEQPGFGFGMDADVASVTDLAPRRAAKAKDKAEDDKAKDDKAKGKAGRRADKAQPADGDGTSARSTDEAGSRAEAAAAAKAERVAAREAERLRKKELTARQRTLDRREREATRLAKAADEAEEEARTARATADDAAEAAEAARRAVAELEP